MDVPPGEVPAERPWRGALLGVLQTNEKLNMFPTPNMFKLEGILSMRLCYRSESMGFTGASESGVQVLPCLLLPFLASVSPPTLRTGSGARHVLCSRWLPFSISQALGLF